MTKTKISRELVDLEYFFQKYFKFYIAPIADSAVRKAGSQFVEEGRDTIKGAGNTFGSTMPGLDTFVINGKLSQTESYKSYWSNVQQHFSKSFESDSRLTADMGHLVDEYQRTLLKIMGKDRYAKHSEKVGGDLATWYVNNKILEMSLSRMAEKGVPKSTLEYLIHKGSESSLLGLTNPDDWTEMMSLQGNQYHPSRSEKIGGYVVGGAMDFAIMPVGGMKSIVKWGAAGAGLDIAFSEGGRQETIDVMMSRAMYGKTNILNLARKCSVDINKSSTIQHLNKNMNHQIRLDKDFDVYWNPSEMNLFTPDTTIKEQKQNKESKGSKSENKNSKNSSKTHNIPAPIAPEKEKEYMDSIKTGAYTLQSYKADTPTEQSKRAENNAAQNSAAPSYTTQNDTASNKVSQNQTLQKQATQSTNGWNGILSGVGLSGFSDVFKNMGYVLAMLPDMMLGMLTGRTKTLKVGDNLMPVAAIVMGMFVRNPLLKMLLIGLGG